MQVFFHAHLNLTLCLKNRFTAIPCHFSKKRMPREDRSGWSITDWLYRHRHGAAPWLVMTLVGLGLGSTVLLFTVWRFDYVTVMMIVQSPIWTVVLAIVASPLAYYVWLVRDRNALETRRRAKEVELIKQFHQLQEWVASNQDQHLRIGAILQLQDYVLGASYLFPPEMEYFRGLQARVLDFLLFLLRDRTLYDPGFDATNQTKLGVTQLSPVAQAMASMLTVCAKHFPTLDSIQAIGMKLMDMPFGEQSVRDADFSRADLTRTDSYRTDFTGSIFEGAILRDAKFTHASLEYCNFTDAQLLGTYFAQAVLMNAQFSGSRLQRVIMNSVNAATSLFGACLLVDVEAVAANFTSADFTAARISNSNFEGANFTDTNFFGAKLSNSIFYGANFKGAVLTDASITGCIFSQAMFDQRTSFPEGFDRSMMIEVK